MNSNKEIILRGRLSGEQRNRFGRLQNMMYTPTELAEEIGFNRRQVYRVYRPLGCPHEYTNNGRRLWINGLEFKNWYQETYKKRHLDTDETFCLTCKRAVKIENPQKYKSGRITYWLSYCPHCGRKSTRIIKNSRG